MRIVTLLLAIAAYGAQAADAPPRAVFSKPTPKLKLAERSDSYERGSFARWIGQVTLTGKLVVEFDRGNDGQEMVDRDGGIHFEPDDTSRRLLPAALNYHPKPTQVLWIGGTAKEVLEPLVGRKAFDDLYRGRAARFYFPVRIQITEFRTEVECDSRHYSILVKDIRLLRPKGLTLAGNAPSGC